MKNKQPIIQVLELDDFPSVAEELDTACTDKDAFLAFIDMGFYNSLRSALELHPDQTKHIIEALASPNIVEFSFEAQRKPIRIWKQVIDSKNERSPHG